MIRIIITVVLAIVLIVGNYWIAGKAEEKEEKKSVDE